MAQIDNIDVSPIEQYMNDLLDGYGKESVDMLKTLDECIQSSKEAVRQMNELIERMQSLNKSLGQWREGSDNDSVV